MLKARCVHFAPSENEPMMQMYVNLCHCYFCTNPNPKFSCFYRYSKGFVIFLRLRINEI